MAGDQVESARKRLASALDSGIDSGIDSGKEYGHVKDKATEGAKADVALREHPYKAVATGIGLGPSLAISLRAGATNCSGSPARHLSGLRCRGFCAARGHDAHRTAGVPLL